MNMVFGNATLHWIDASNPERNWQSCIESWQSTASNRYPVYEVFKKPIMVAYQEIFENTTEEIISYTHDDTLIFEKDWDLRVAKEFEDPTVGMVGLGGATGYCHPLLYKKPFDYMAMGRVGFASNMREAEVHGQRFTGERDVAVFDGFSLFVRRSVLEKCGGWPQGVPVSYWGYDTMMSVEVIRQGLRNRLVGIACDHISGRSPSLISEDLVAASKWIYDNYRDVIPYYVRPE